MKQTVRKTILKAKWVIKLPEDTKILVNEGKSVEKGDLLAVQENGVIESFECGVVLAKMPKEKIREIEDKWKNNEIKKGELLFSTGGLFGKQVFSPFEGVFIGIDEFHNVKIETRKEERKEFRSPINAKVAKVEKSRIVLEFRAKNIKGKGVNSGKVWGKINSQVITKINDLSSELEGMVILAKDINKAFLTKADVMGVKGLVTDEKIEAFDDSTIDLPILIMDEDGWSKLSGTENEGRQVLLNSKSGRLLLVVE